MAKIDVEVGLLMRGRMRQYLNEMKFYGADVAYMESKSLLVSSFSIKGSEDAIMAIKRRVDSWN